MYEQQWTIYTRHVLPAAFTFHKKWPFVSHASDPVVFHNVSLLRGCLEVRLHFEHNSAFNSTGNLELTRQSSCVTARGVPPAPRLQMFPKFLSYIWGDTPKGAPPFRGVPPVQGVPPGMRLSSVGIPLGAPSSGGCPPFRGVPPGAPLRPWPGGTPDLDLGAPGPWLGPWLGGAPCGQTNWKHYLPVILRMRAVNIPTCTGCKKKIVAETFKENSPGCFF